MIDLTQSTKEERRMLSAALDEYVRARPGSSCNARELAKLCLAQVKVACVKDELEERLARAKAEVAELECRLEGPKP